MDGRTGEEKVFEHIVDSRYERTSSDFYCQDGSQRCCTCSSGPNFER